MCLVPRSDTRRERLYTENKQFGNLDGRRDWDMDSGKSSEAAEQGIRIVCLQVFQYQIAARLTLGSTKFVDRSFVLTDNVMRKS